MFFEVNTLLTHIKSIKWLRLVKMLTIEWKDLKNRFHNVLAKKIDVP